MRVTGSYTEDEHEHRLYSNVIAAITQTEVVKFFECLVPFLLPFLSLSGETSLIKAPFS